LSLRAESVSLVTSQPHPAWESQAELWKNSYPPFPQSVAGWSLVRSPAGTWSTEVRRETLGPSERVGQSPDQNRVESARRENRVEPLVAEPAPQNQVRIARR